MKLLAYSGFKKARRSLAQDGWLNARNVEWKTLIRSQGATGHVLKK